MVGATGRGDYLHHREYISFRLLSFLRTFLSSSITVSRETRLLFLMKAPSITIFADFGLE